MPKALALFATVAFIAGACQSRPLDIATPEPWTDSILVSATMAAVTLAAIEAVEAEGMSLRVFDADAGLVETEYFDLLARLTLYRDLPERERHVRFRILIESQDSATTVVGVQTLFNPFWPRPVSRYYERTVDRNHPGTELARRILKHVRDLTTEAVSSD